MARRIAALVSPLLLLLAGGCATTQTSLIDDSLDGQEGISYHLPEAQFEVTLYDAGAKGVGVSITGPTIVADPSYRLVTRLPHGIISNNDVKIVADETTNLLSTVDTTSTGQLEQLVSAAVKSGVGLQSAPDATGSTNIHKENYTLSEIAETKGPAGLSIAQSDVFAELRLYHRQKCVTPDKESRAANCPLMKKALGLGPSGLFSVDVFRRDVRKQDVNFDFRDELVFTKRDFRSFVNERCGDALCYHPLESVKIKYGIGDFWGETDYFLVPDKRKLNYVRMRSGVFAEQVYNLSFSKGVLTSYQQNSQSEAVGLVSLPLNIVKSVIAAPAEVLAERQNALKAETDLLTAVGSNIEARGNARKKCEDNPEECSGTTVRRAIATIIPDLNVAEPDDSATYSEEGTTDP